MPYQSGPTLQALGMAEKLATMENPLESARKRRRESLEDSRLERQMKLDEKKFEAEQAAAKKEEELQQAELAKRKAAFQSLPPKPGPGSTPEQKAGWYILAAEHMTINDMLEAAAEFREQANRAHQQGVVSPVELEGTRATTESTRIGTEETQRELDAGTPEETAEKIQTEAELNRARTRLADAQTDAGGFAPTAGSKPRTTEQLLKEDIVIRQSWEDIYQNELGLEWDEETEMPVTPVNVDNREYLRDIYSEEVKQSGPDKARELMRNGMKVVHDYGRWGEGDNETYLIPKAWIQWYQQRLGREATEEEMLAAWKVNLGVWRGEQYGR